jgi:thiol-disulfide isomerase/thioredoxin
MRRLALLAVVVLLAAAMKLYATGTTEAQANFVLQDPPRPLPQIAIADGDGKASSLPDFRGKFVLLNVWATWCVPCRKEMPTLDRLQGLLGGPDFQVIALSIDRGGADAVRKFYGEIGVERLAIQLDVGGEAFQKLGVVGLPTTVLIDREGREVGRLIGPAEWDSPKMIAFLKSIVAKPTGPAPAAQPEEKHS